MTVNDLGSGGIVYFELEDESNINLNVGSPGLKLLIGDKVFNEFTSIELINNKVFINDNETGIYVSFSEETSFIEIQDIYGNSNQLSAPQIDNINIQDTQIVTGNSQDLLISSNETSNEINEITIIDEQSYVSNITEIIEEDFTLDLDVTDNHHEIIDNLGADDDLFIDDEDISELISNDNNLISNNSVQMVDLEGQEFSLISLVMTPLVLRNCQIALKQFITSKITTEILKRLWMRFYLPLVWIVSSGTMTLI